MPRSSNLPDDLKLLARRNALDVSHNRFNADFGRLVSAIEGALKKAEAEGKQREAKDRVEADRLVAEGREKDRLKTQPQVKERQEAEARRREKQAEAVRERRVGGNTSD